MKQTELKKSFHIFLCYLCAFLFLSTAALESSSVKQNIASENPIMRKVFPDLSEMFQHVNESRLRSYVYSIQAFGPHPTGSIRLIALRDYLYNEFCSMNLSVRFDSWHEKQQSGDNIVATLPTTTENDAAVIICAHYDTLAISPGAEDDGSGVAAVLIIADIMHRYSFNTTVYFILFSGEEQGLLGSRSYAKNASDSHKNILGVLALDKIGYAVTSDEGNSVHHHANPASTWMVRLSQSIALEYPTDIGLIVHSLPIDSNSDHFSFVEKGYAGTNFVRNATNPYYHTSEDIADYMNFSYLTKVCKLALGTIASMAWLYPVFSTHDFKIILKGSRLANPAQFSILVENSNEAAGSANVTVMITLKHLVRGEYVSMIKQEIFTPCNRSINKEIRQSWRFDVAGRRFSRGFFLLNVTLVGRVEDLYLYSSQQTYGVIVNPFCMVIIPRL